MVILHAGNEQVNSHIIDYFDKHKINHEERALKTGDYSFKIKSCPDLGFLKDTYFTDELCIERKNSVDEIAGNMSSKDDRFLKELNRMINIENCYILIEDSKLDDVITGNYRSQYNKLSFIRTLLTIQRRSGFYLNFVNKENMGFIIYEICKNVLDSKILK